MGVGNTRWLGCRVEARTALAMAGVSMVRLRKLIGAHLRRSLLDLFSFLLAQVVAHLQFGLLILQMGDGHTRVR